MQTRAVRAPRLLPALRVPRLALNFTLLSSAELAGKALAAVSFAYLARVLGPVEYGRIEFALTVAVFLSLLVDLGLSSYGAREVAKDPASAAGVALLIVQITTLRMLLAAATFALLCVVVVLLPQPPATKHLLLLYGITLFAIPGMLQWVFQGRDQMHLVAAASLSRFAVFAGGVLALVRGPQHLWRVPLAEAAGLGAVVLVCAVALARSAGAGANGTASRRLDWRALFEIARQAFPIGGGEIAWALKTYGATLVLALTVGGASVGWFGAAQRLVGALHAFVWLYYFNLLPSFARAVQHPGDDLQRLLRGSLRLTAWAALGIGVLGTALAGPVVGLVYGPDYAEAVPVLRVLIWMIPIALISGNYRFTLIAAGRQRLDFLGSAAGAGLSVILNLFLTPLHGVQGAAAAQIVAEAAVLALAYFWVRRTVYPAPLPVLGWPPGGSAAPRRPANARDA